MNKIKAKTTKTWYTTTQGFLNRESEKNLNKQNFQLQYSNIEWDILFSLIFPLITRTNQARLFGDKFSIKKFLFRIQSNHLEFFSYYNIVLFLFFN